MSSRGLKKSVRGFQWGTFKRMSPLRSDVNSLIVPAAGTLHCRQYLHPAMRHRANRPLLPLPAKTMDSYLFPADRHHFRLAAPHYRPALRRTLYS
jgi:hypothetical protein